MTEKRFYIIGDSNIEFLLQTKLLLPIYDKDKQLSLKECVDCLNALHEENEQLKSRVNDLEDLNRIYVDFMISKGYELSDVME